MMFSLIIWLLLLVFFIVLEALTVGLTSIWFAGGALTAAIAVLLGAGTIVQLILFIAVSVVLLVFTRPFARKFMQSQTKTRTNVDSLQGKRAIVTERIDNLHQTGKVRINDVDWLARSVQDQITIPEKAQVAIDLVQGVKLIVHEVK